MAAGKRRGRRPRAALTTRSGPCWPASQARQYAEAVAVHAPPPVVTGPLRRLAADVRDERSLNGGLPPGPTDFSLARTRAFARNPLPLLLDAYRAHGPVFSMRILHAHGVFMLGPEANHYMTVSHADNFRWREGSMGDLIPFLGDGLLTTDGEYHRRSRKVMLPAFHRERLEAATDVMFAEAERAVAALGAGRGARPLRVDARARAADRAEGAVRARPRPRRAARRRWRDDFERGLGYYGRDYFLQILRGPRTPWAAMQQARAPPLPGAARARSRAAGAGEEHGEDVLGLLIDDARRGRLALHRRAGPATR